MPARPAMPTRPVLPVVLAAGALVAGTLLLFSRALGYGFINYDDPGYVTNNPYVQGGLTRAGVLWAFTGHSDYWHPLTWLSHMLDWRWFGPNATGHRAVNLLWHATNAVLVFALFRRLFARPALAWFAAALFAWHPLRVESVVWVTERKDVMSGCFFLLTLLAYLRYGRRRAAGEPAAGAYGLTLAAFLAGLMCKPSLVTLPLVLLALDFWPLQRGDGGPHAPGWRRLIGEKLPFFALAAVIAVVTIHMQATVGAFALEVGPAGRAGNALVSIARYLGKFLWPSDLAIFYAHPGAWPWPAVLGAGALVAALSVGAWRQRTRRPALLTGWLWFLAMLLPTLGLLQVGLQAMADRYTYLATLGCEVALLGALPALPRFRVAAAGLAAAGLAACAAATWQQQAYWSDSLTLYRHAIAVDGRNAFARAFLAYTHLSLGQHADAEREARATLAVDPVNQWAWITLAEVLEETGRYPDAIDAYRRLAAINPQSVRCQTQLGQLLRNLRRIDEAGEAFDRAAALAPGDPGVLLNQAELLSLRRRFDESAAVYERILVLAPDHAEAHAALGYLRLLAGRRAEAADHWRAALRARPDFPGLRERLRQLEP